MADVHDKKTRSFNMSPIKGKNTRPEILVSKFLFSKGFRFRLHDKRLPGKPDIVLPKQYGYQRTWLFLAWAHGVSLLRCAKNENQLVVRQDITQ